jgi:hypothetical protein
MKTFKDIIEEATTEINQLPRRSKAFVDKHVVQKTDYPVDAEDQFTAKKVKKDKTKLASFHDGEDAAVYEEVDLDEATKTDDHWVHINHAGNMPNPKKDTIVGYSRPSKNLDASQLKAGANGAMRVRLAKEKGYVIEEVDLDEGVSNLSDARLKFHVLKDIPHGSYTKKEMAAEHDRRKKTGGAEYNAVKPSLNEEVNLDEEVSFKKMDSGDHHIHHNGNPVGRIVKTNSMGSSGYSVRFGGNTSKHEVSDESSLSAAKQSAKWHLTSNESPLKKESVDLDEAKTDIYHKHMLKALGKTRLPKDHGYTSSIANNGDFVVRKGGEVAGRIPKGEHDLKEASMTPTDMKQREAIVKGMKKSAQDFKDRYGSKWKSVMYATATKAAMKEESEQIDEISRDLARSYIRKVADKNNTGEASPKEVMKRSPGVALAGKKAYGIGGKAKVKATESVDLDEAFKAGSMKLNDGSSVTLTNESSNSLNNLFNQLSSQNKTKMEQRLMSGSKGFNEILAFAKEV